MFSFIWTYVHKLNTHYAHLGRSYARILAAGCLWRYLNLGYYTTGRLKCQRLFWEIGDGKV